MTDVSLNLVVMGVSGVGKSTVGIALAAALGWRYIEGDEFHPQVNRDKMASGAALDDDDRWPWLDTLVDELNTTSGPAVLGCSALKLRYRDRLRCAQAPLRFVWLRGDESLVSERLNQRQGHYMPSSLLRSQFEALETPLAAERVLEVDVRQPVQALVATITSQLDLDAA